MMSRRMKHRLGRPSRRLFLGLLLVSILAGTAPRIAVADPVDDAKAAGLIGEQPDGYLGVVAADAPADVVTLVKRTNAKRQAAYTQIAASTGSTAEAVGQIAAQKLYAKAAPGTYLQAPDGTWAQK